MGFPESLRIPLLGKRAYKQFGNSVVVLLITEVARALQPLIAMSAHRPPEHAAWNAM